MEVAPRNQRNTLIKDSEDPVKFWLKSVKREEDAYFVFVVTGRNPESKAVVELEMFVPKKGPRFESFLESCAPEVYERGGALIGGNLIGRPFLGRVATQRRPKKDPETSEVIPGMFWDPENTITEILPAPPGTPPLGAPAPAQKPAYNPPQGKPQAPNPPAKPVQQPVASRAQQQEFHDQPEDRYTGDQADDDIPF